MFFVLICSLIGLWLGGFYGLLVGGAAALVLRQAVRVSLRHGLQRVQTQFIESTFRVMGAVCKADGVVTQDEIRVAEQIFLRLRLSPEQKEAAKAAFNRGKAPDFDLDAELQRFVLAAPRGSILFPLFLQLQLMAIAADGQVHPAEREMLLRIARGLGLAERDLARLEASLRAAVGGFAAQNGPPPQQQLDDAYAALGVAPEASETELKRAYRKLMKENHPDKLAAKGLPESMRELAEERAREINAAYALVKRARELS